MTGLATISIEPPAARLVLQRAEQRNALSLELLESLHECVDALHDGAGVRVLEVTGAGRAFCAGMDLKQVIIDEAAGGSGDPALPLRLLRSLARLTWRLRRLSCVTVATVNGAAIGGGCGLACVCDVLVTSADAKLGFPEVDLGLCPAVVAPLLVRKIGAGRARRMLLTGQIVSGEEAYRLGMADELAADAAALPEVAGALVERIAGGGDEALSATKRLLNDLDGSLNESIPQLGAALSASVLATPEAQANLIGRLRK